MSITSSINYLRDYLHREWRLKSDEFSLALGRDGTIIIFLKARGVWMNRLQKMIRWDGYPIQFIEAELYWRTL